MMEKLKYTKFKTLLISSFICISIIPVVLLGLFIFHLSKQELIRQSEKQMWQNSENVSDILDEKLDYIEEFSLKINVDTRIYKIFQNLDTSDSMQLESASQEISKILLDYLPWNNTVYSTHIVTPYYQFGEKEKNYYPNYSFMGSKIQKAADEANGKLVWIPAYNYMDMFSIEDMPRDFLEYEHVFTAVRKLQLSRVESGHIEHLENKTDQMYLVVNFTEDNLNNMLKKYTKANSQILYYIMSEDGSVVGPYGENESKLFRNVTAADMGITENKGTVKYYGANNQEYIVTYSKSMVTGWYTLAMIPVNVFSKNIATDLTRAILILVTIEIILSVTTAVLISRKIGKKVYKPLHMIEKTGEGNFTAIGILNIINTVYTNIHTRVTEIGMQRAIGMSAGSLYKTFLWEGAYYGIIASVIGSVLGYVCTIFIEAATSDTLQLVAIPVIPILEATLLAVGACLMATAIPLRKISKMSIVDSIETVE